MTGAQSWVFGWSTQREEPCLSVWSEPIEDVFVAQNLLKISSGTVFAKLLLCRFVCDDHCPKIRHYPPESTMFQLLQARTEEFNSDCQGRPREYQESDQVSSYHLVTKSFYHLIARSLQLLHLRVRGRRVSRVELLGEEGRPFQSHHGMVWEGVAI